MEYYDVDLDTYIKCNRLNENMIQVYLFINLGYFVWNIKRNG